jgi:TetR/AcrR family transcriptional repressor of nem operon
MGVIMPRKSDKRERLVQSAKDLMFRQGFNLTTLADIAQEADVPLGNVYYYFKTKESIGEAVITHCVSELNQRLHSYDTFETAAERLNAYLDHELNELDWNLKHGDRLGSLCQELAKQGGPLANISSSLLQNSINWLTKQFVELGVSQAEAAERALAFIAKLQGCNLLAATLKSKEGVEPLKKWLRAEISNASAANSHAHVTHHEVEEAYA